MDDARACQWWSRFVQAGSVWWMVQRVALAVGLLLMITGCAADRDARELASRLRKLTAQYEALSTKKLEAEQKFYLDSLKNLDRTLNVVDPGGASIEDMQRDIKKTVAYGRIITTANREALRLAEALVSSADPPLTAGAISEFVRDGVKADEQAYLQARQMQATISEVLAVDFAKMSDYQKRIAELSKGLVELEMPASSAARQAQLRAIGEAVLIQLRSESAKDATK